MTTPNKYEFHYVRTPDTLSQGFTFEVKAAHDVRVALSNQSGNSADMFEIVIGGWSNMLSWISLGKEGELVHTKYYLTGIFLHRLYDSLL